MLPSKPTQFNTQDTPFQRQVPLLLLLKLFKGNAPEQQETLHCTHLGDTLGAVSTLQVGNRKMMVGQKTERTKNAPA